MICDKCNKPADEVWVDEETLICDNCNMEPEKPLGIWINEDYMHILSNIINLPINKRNIANIKNTILILRED